MGVTESVHRRERFAQVKSPELSGCGGKKEGRGEWEKVYPNLTSDVREYSPRPSCSLFHRPRH